MFMKQQAMKNQQDLDKQFQEDGSLLIQKMFHKMF